MKFRDIPQFTQGGSYQVDIPLSHLLRVLDGYKKDFGLEMNPDFQRGSVWSKEQQIKYLEFFFQGGKTARIIYFNCPSFGRETERCNIPNMVLVDGLQRLTSFIGFLNNEIPIFETYYKDFEDNLRDSSTFIKFNINDLQTKAEVLQWYIEMNTGGTIHSNEEINRVKKLLAEELIRGEK